MAKRTNKKPARQIAMPTFLLSCNDLQRKLEKFKFHNGGKPLQESMEKIRTWAKDESIHTIILNSKDSKEPVCGSSDTIAWLSDERSGFIVGGGRVLVEAELQQKDIDVLNNIIDD